MAFPIALITMAAGLLADQQRKAHSRKLSREDRQYAKQDLLQSVLNRNASAMGGDPIAASTLASGANIDRGYNREMRALDDQPVDYGAALGMLGRTFDDFGGDNGGGPSKPSDIGRSYGEDELSKLDEYERRQRELMGKWGGR